VEDRFKELKTLSWLVIILIMTVIGSLGLAVWHGSDQRRHIDGLTEHNSELIEINHENIKKIEKMLLEMQKMQRVRP
jgi:hypothetical protein